MGINYKTYSTLDDNQEFLISYYFHTNGMFKSRATVEEWVSVPFTLTKFIIDTYPNAKKAHEIKNSKLAKVLE